MSKIAKIVIVILALLLVGSVFFALSALSQKSAVEKEKTILEDEIKKYKEGGEKLGLQNRKISEELEEAKAAKDKLQKQIADFDSQLSALSSDRDNWKNRVDGVKEERNQLVAKIEELEKSLEEANQAAKEAAQKAAAAQPSLVSATQALSAPDLSAGQQGEYWAGVLKEKASLEVTVNDLKQRLSTGLVEAEELRKKNTELEAALSELKTEKEEIERKIKYNDDLANTLSAQLYKEKDEKKYLAEKLDKIQEDNAATRTQIKELSESKIALEKSIIKLTEDKAAVERKLSETESTLHDRANEVLGIKEGLEKDFQSLTATANKKEVELSPIVVRAVGSPDVKEKRTKAVVPEEGSKARAERSSDTKKGKKEPPKKDQSVDVEEVAPDAKDKKQISEDSNQSERGLKGSVLSINQKDNFVIVNLGEDTGVQPGDTLGVYRGGDHITDLGVIQVRKNVSAADIKEKGAKIKVGDIVK